MAITSYFPTTQELMYWNENMGTGNFVVLALPEDIVDNDGELGFVQEITQYFRSCWIILQWVKTASGDLYVSYSAHMENFDNGYQNFRHIYVTRSNDVGVNWSRSQLITPRSLQFDYYEAISQTWQI